MDRYIPLREAKKVFGLGEQTLRKYAEDGRIPAKRSPGNRWLFKVEEGPVCGTVCYCRVSSAKQRDDLARQVVYMRENFPKAEIIQDIGSGLNFKRKGLKTLLDRLHRGDKLSVVVAHKDRLSRFGSELIKYFIEKNGGELLVLDQSIHSPQSELTQDLLSILTVFSCRMHGLRRYSNQIKKDKNLSNESPEETP